MSAQTLETQDHLQDTIRQHRKDVQKIEWHERSLDKTGTGTTAEMQIVNEQLERNMDAFYEGKPCDLCGEYCEEGKCLHADCKDEPCQDCIENMTDRAHDMADMER